MRGLHGTHLGDLDNLFELGNAGKGVIPPSGPSGPYVGWRLEDKAGNLIYFNAPSEDFRNLSGFTYSFWAFIGSVKAGGTNKFLIHSGSASDPNYLCAVDMLITSDSKYWVRLLDGDDYSNKYGGDYYYNDVELNVWRHYFIEYDPGTYSGTLDARGIRMWINNEEITWDSIVDHFGASAGLPNDLPRSPRLAYYGFGHAPVPRLGNLKFAQFRAFKTISGGGTRLADMWNGGAGLGSEYTDANMIQEVLFTEGSGLTAEDTSTAGADHDAAVGGTVTWVSGDFSETTF